MVSYYSENFLLKWNYFWLNIGSPYHDLGYNPDFYDVTLVNEDKKIEAHTIIFPEYNPFLYSKGIHIPTP